MEFAVFGVFMFTLLAFSWPLAGTYCTQCTMLGVHNVKLLWLLFLLFLYLR